MAETVSGGVYLSQDGVTYHDANGKVIAAPKPALSAANVTAKAAAAEVLGDDEIVALVVTEPPPTPTPTPPSAVGNTANLVSETERRARERAPGARRR